MKNFNGTVGSWKNIFLLQFTHLYISIYLFISISFTFVFTVLSASRICARMMTPGSYLVSLPAELFHLAETAVIQENTTQEVF